MLFLLLQSVPVDVNQALLLLIAGVTPVAVYVVVELARKYTPLLPSWVTPIVTMLLGLAINWVNGLVSGGTMSPVEAALLGAGAIVLNEILKAIRR